MVNSALFNSAPRGAMVRHADTVNNAGGQAYKLSDHEALAQMAMTGTFNNNFYMSANDILKQVADLCTRLPSEYIAKVAIYAREEGYNKDFPSYLLAVLAARTHDPVVRQMFPMVFQRVVNNGKMLLNFAKIIRSGQVGRKSFGSLLRRVIREWLVTASNQQLFNAAVGGADMDIADLIRMVHPKASDPQRNAFFAYLLNREVEIAKLPPMVQAYEAYKNNPNAPVPAGVPFLMLIGVERELSHEHWLTILQQASWTNLRMGLVTFARRGIYDNPNLTKLIADRLSNEEEVRKAKIFPYQLYTAIRKVDGTVPKIIADALEKALMISLDNTPVFEGDVVSATDISGSMKNPITGHNARSRRATTATRCVDVAALINVSIRHRNPGRAMTLLFDDRCTTARERGIVLNDSVVDNAAAICARAGGGTSTETVLIRLNQTKPELTENISLIVITSDNETWSKAFHGWQRSYPIMMDQWRLFKKRHPKAKLVLIDLTPGNHTQVPNEDGVLNIGGFSDTIFDLIQLFVNDQLGPDRWVGEINKVELI